MQYFRPRQTVADHGGPKYSDIRGATSISDAFILLMARYNTKQARESSEDTQVAGYARFEKVLAR